LAPGNLKEDIIAGLGWGADDYLTKPFDPEGLRARVPTRKRILHLKDNLVKARRDALQGHARSLTCCGIAA
jgi:DNA-binding response OmpR family regulator